MKRISLILLFSLMVGWLASAKTVTVASPDGNLKFVLDVTKSEMTYKVSLGKNMLIKPSGLGFVFEDAAFGENMIVTGIDRRTVDETYSLITGKVAEARDHCNEAVVHLAHLSKNGKKMDIVIRVYDDGAAFRFAFPEQEGWNGFVMLDELTEFIPAGNPDILYMDPFPGTINTHENTYSFSPYSEMKENMYVDMPVTMQYADGAYVSITEAAIRNYAGMYLMKYDGSMHGKLSPRLGQERVKVIIDSFPCQTPWRVISASENLEDILESTILYSLNEPCQSTDTDWIKPCNTTFTWWNGNMIPVTNFSPGNNFETNKVYIDFCAENGIDLHNIYGYAETAWYVNDSYNFGWPGPNADVTKPIASLDMNRIAAYARSKGVGLHLWVHWKPLYDKLDEAFALYESWGVRGLMVDFMDRNDQEMIIIQEEILKSAMKHHLFIQFHGSSKPSGLIRTYPCEFTREGTLNYEILKWETRANSDHIISIPFTRMLAGPADFHMGGFRSLPRDKFVIRYTDPYVLNTRCHMLGLYIVLENYLTSLCDTPMAYEGQPGFEFLCEVPADWSDMKVLDSKLNEYIAIARLHGEDWWVGAITDHEARDMKLDLDFLEEGAEYEAVVYTDAEDTDVNPNNLVKNVTKVRKGDSIDVKLASDGGCALILRKKR